MFVLLPTAVCVPVTLNFTVSPSTRPSSVPPAVSGFPLYVLLALAVSTVTGLGTTTMLPSTFVMLSLLVTSSPCAFTIDRWSLVTVTGSLVTSVTLASDLAIATL